VRNENGDQLADSHNIFNRWKNYFSHLRNLHGVGAVRQREIYSDYSFLPDPNHVALKLLLQILKGITREVTASVVWWSEFLATDPDVWVRFPALPDFLRSSESGTGFTQPRDDN
jgi:hypothetical protein